MYTSVAFSPDGKTLAAMGGAPEWHLVVWLWEKSKVLATIKCSNAERSPVHQVCWRQPRAANPPPPRRGAYSDTLTANPRRRLPFDTSGSLRTGFHTALSPGGFPWLQRAIRVGPEPPSLSARWGSTCWTPT